MTSDIKIRIVSPVTDRSVVPGKHTGTDGVTGNDENGTDKTGTNRVPRKQTGIHTTRSHNSKQVNVMRSESHTAHNSTIQNNVRY